MAGKQSVREGIHQISKGDLQYKIDLATLTGETYEMARAVNEMGDGLQEAVEAMKNAGYREIRLGVDYGNPQSFAFWSKNKFVVIQEKEYIVMKRVLS